MTVPPPATGLSGGPVILIPRKLNPHGVSVCSRPGAITPWGNERASYRILTGDPRGWAETAADNGLLVYKGNDHYADLNGHPLSPEDVLPRFKSQLRSLVGHRWLPVKEGNKVLTPFGGQIPEGMRDIKAFMGMTANAVRATSFGLSWNNIIKVAEPDALYMLFAGARMYLNAAYHPEETLPDPKTIGIHTGRGLPGLNAFINLIEASLKGRDQTPGMRLPQILQSAALGVWMSIIGPKNHDMGARTFGSNLQGSSECATFLALAAAAADKIGTLKPGKTPLQAVQIGVGEEPHGREDARLCAVGFNSMTAMETLKSLAERSGAAEGQRDKIDLWYSYAPFVYDRGFWPSAGGAFLEYYNLPMAIKEGLLFDAVLLGYGAYSDEGGKSNHAQLGNGIYHAIFEGLRMAYEGFGIAPHHLDYVNFHGTQTPDTNKKEPLYLLEVLRQAARAFGIDEEELRRRKRKIKAAALKAFLGHGLGVAGGMELAMMLQILRHQKGPGILNGHGRPVVVPTEILEWIDFSEDPIEDDIRVAAMMSEGFSGNNVFKIFHTATGDMGDEFLLRFEGITADVLRSLRQRQAERIANSHEIEEAIRTGRMSYTDFLEWVSWKEKAAHQEKTIFKTGWSPSQETDLKALSPTGVSLRQDLQKLAYSVKQGIVVPLVEIRNVLNAETKSFASLIERLEDVIPRLREGDPSAIFPQTGLPHVIKVLTSHANALEVLSKSSSVLETIQDLVNPWKLTTLLPKAIPTDATLSTADRRLALTYPGQGAFDGEKRTASAKALYENSQAYAAVIDAGHERLMEKYGYDLKAMLFAGSADQLLDTKNQQPVLVADEIGRDESLQPFLKDIPIQAVYGDSLGLIPAAYRSGYFASPADAIEFAYLRGQVMGSLNPFGAEARPMALVTGYDEGQVKKVVHEINDGLDRHVVVSKRNGVGKLVLSGDPEAIQLVNQRLVERGGKSGISIPVSTPFHDRYYFKDAAEELLRRSREAGIANVRRKRIAPLIANSTGGAVSDDVSILEFLANEIAEGVDLVASAQTARGLGANTFFEIGPKSTLTSDIGTALGALAQTQEPVHAAYIPTVDELAKLLH